MKIIRTELPGVQIIEPKVFEDSRGWFTEIYSKKMLENAKIYSDFLQDNHSYSAEKGTLRGLHFQIEPKAQAKLVRCTKGKIVDVAVDIRRGSPTYKRWVKVELSAENKRQLFIPRGFAHGFLTLTDEVEVQYKVDEYYSPEHDRGIRYDDEDINVDWGIVQEPILSEKDERAPFLRDSDANFSVKVLLTGTSGQLGKEIKERLKELNIAVIATFRNDFDITSRESVRTFFLKEKPDIIVHCAAYTAVDQAETERELCYSINAEGTKNIAEVAKEIDATLVYVSTDYVFDGESPEPYLPNEKTKPVNYYGLTKEQGEKIVANLLDKYFIVRTSWLYGDGKNFVKTMLKLSQEQQTIRVVNDQVGTPTYTKDLANLIVEMIQTTKYGIYHGVNEGYCSWYDFAVEIFKEANIAIKVEPILSAEYITKAKRPNNSRLSTENLTKNGFQKMPTWQNALKRYLEILQENIEG
ncbi:MAG: dTDP-4-dehydrorhamnose reductase [Eubacteriaceae bacterium]|jgi:dTDP-4-dehydrorhamnose reductase/dTDP-4-dehydrorhamnose 3,5-epimerase|nr:dTDP-4-dehydrorhamnose reductase [Eubacteriaceae bacterium]